MIQNKCQIDSHKQRKMLSICFGTKCLGKRLCCQICQIELHKDHPDQLVDVDYILNFIKTESKGPIVVQPWINQKLQSFQKILNDLEDLSKFIREEMLKLSSLNVQQFCKDLGNKYNILKEDAQVSLSDQNWNQLTEDMLTNLGAQNCEIVQKDATDSLSSSMTNIRDKVKSIIQEELNPIHINKEYFKSFKGPQLTKGHTGMVWGIDVCKQRNLLASGSDDKTVKLWSLVDNVLIKSYAYSGLVYDVVFSNQGDQLAFGGGGDFYIKLIDISDLNKTHVVHEFFGHSQWIRRLVFSNNSKFLISGSEDNTVRIWDLQRKKEAFQIKSEGFVNGVGTNADDSIIASNSQDGKIQIWNLIEKKLLCSQAAHISGSGISFSRNQNILVSSSFEGITKLWSLEYLKNHRKLILIQEFKKATNCVWTVLFSPCSRFIIQICNPDGEIKILDSQTGELIQLFKSDQINNQQNIYKIQKNRKIIGLSISKDMDLIAYSENTNIAVWRNQQ